MSLDMMQYNNRLKTWQGGNADLSALRLSLLSQHWIVLELEPLQTYMHACNTRESSTSKREEKENRSALKQKSREKRGRDQECFRRQPQSATC